MVEIKKQDVVYQLSEENQTKIAKFLRAGETSITDEEL